ncbi:phospholipase D-like domain-containing protein [Leptospira sp. 2 VSF19]|uniref:phospholipase D n=1 Tax=Leptospira soteropolitanensis TaxID=2950025 RepID=A0AAW5VH80_9LEPT|nr:phospholipase D-like domain-containing protein [Leptospira soteropolitanensis]MCW7493114.1 phospholipase D-like domain-containing protein [Leptospira soteropolitanensis]MCW7500817.1 phospholipase D-like domain-containing protein [Leptospira soteropolitanensis]MCW7522964.1 phospholipase D-like domain-containing protein [Leptospira soteropolitanensis]MCW7526929.1 phospholipase D-like domain-containing protein [Leptospira soteropolitanensis]MCW7530682.1 phospholipase D-like domain-containing p
MTKIKWILFLLISMFFLFCQKPKSKVDLSWLLLPTSPISELYFSYPGRNVAEDKKRIVKDALISEIRKAKVSIHAYLYSIDDYEILSELYLKKRMGLDIQLYGDKEEEYSELQSLGLEIRRWSGSGIHHTKIWIIDGCRFFAGTGNYTTHGLYTDHNVFWAQNISKDEIESIHSTLLGTNPRGFFRIGSLQYWVSPEAGLEIQQELIEAVMTAKQSIKYLIYSHYDPILSLKLIEASQRGVRVEGIYNAPIMSSNPEGVFLSQNLEYPSQIYEDGNVDFIYKNDRYLGGLLHHKTLIVDDRYVFTGSYNYSVSARDKNKEVFVKMDHPSITEEFLAEWKRVLMLANPISKSFDGSYEEEMENTLRMFSLRQYQNSLFQTNILFNTEGVFDSNSNALSSAYKQTLGLTGPLRTKLGNRFDYTFRGADPIWEESEGENLHLSFQNYFMGTKVSLSSGERVISLSLWDGSHPKENFVLDSNSTVIGNTDFWKGKNLWIWVQTENRRISFCQYKVKTNPPEWMVFLQNRLETLGKLSPICFSG